MNVGTPLSPTYYILHFKSVNISKRVLKSPEALIFLRILRKASFPHFLYNNERVLRN